ncbi:MAG TPA: hypothetical protein VFS23_20225, partial [Vicinamibacterales bacterium]|nr:hypothetical protein [Vicinamibacterales bacterium]
MTEDSGQERRLHPKLRVLKNGDRRVNALRSQGSVLVACATKPLEDEASVEPIYQLSQPDVPWTDQVKPRRGALPKRAKLDASNLAVDSFVNVVIEFHREPPFPPEDATAQGSGGRPGAYGAPPSLDSAIKELEAELRNELPKGPDA